MGADVAPDPNSGAAGTVFHTTQALRDLGHDVDEFWRTDLPHRISHGNLHYLLELPFAYRKTVREKCKAKRYDVIQLSQPHAWLAARDHRRSGRPGIFVNRSHGVELRVDGAVRHWRQRLDLQSNRFPRSLGSAVLRFLLKQSWPKVAKFSDGVMVHCKEDEAYLVSKLKVPPEKVRTIPHGIPESYLEMKCRLLTANRLRRLLHVGQFSFVKGQFFMAKVVNQVLHKSPDMTFTWVCASDHHNSAKALFDSDLLGRINMVDWVNQKELISLYDEHGIFIFTSIAEGGAKVTLEALSRGLCIVATETGGAKDYIKHGNNGFLFKFGQLDLFTNAISQLITDLPISQGISREARLSSLRYTWRRCAEEAVHFYRDLLEPRVNQA